MEATALSLGKSVLDGALGYAKSALAEEVALQLGVQRDHAFIREELEMMRAFLRAAQEERDNHLGFMTWVKQVRDVAYDAEDILQDCSVHLKKPSWWRRPSTLRERRRIAKKMKELRARVEDVSQRNLRYQLVKTSGSKHEDGAEVSGAAVMSGMEESLRQQNKSKMDLIRLINKKDEDLRVIGVWGTSDVLGEKSIVKRAYDGLRRDRKFQHHAWISMVRPLSTTAILQDILMQFDVDSLKEENKKHTSDAEAQDLQRLWMAKEDDLADEFMKFLSEKSYLIVVNDLSTMDEWDQIRACIPTNKKGSRLLVCTQHIKVARLCVEPSTLLPEHKQLFPDKALYAFYHKDITCSVDPGSTSTIDALDDTNSANGKYLTRMETNVTPFKESKLIGRQSEKSQILELISNEVNQVFEVISVWGMGGLGKTTLVKDVYQSPELNSWFDKRACVTVKRPFNPKEVLDSLAKQLSASDETKEWKDDILDGKRYLIILDDLSTPKEWDDIQSHFPRTITESRIIVTTRSNEIARHCSSKTTHIVDLKTLEEKDARDLFTEKVFGKITNLNEECPELYEVAELIMKKCKGLPLAIVTIGGFLAKQPKTPMEWKKLNSHISAELEMNQGLRDIKNVLNKSYDGLPYHLKPCFLYLSIFPEDQDIKRNRLVRRWIAEGYSTEVLGKSEAEIAESYFMELIDRSMILPNKTTYFSTKVIDSCRIHDLMREISISKAAEENLVFRLEQGCSSNTNGVARHLSISNWEGDQADFESMVDVSRIRSLTGFGKWRPFFISDKMRFLRVLDLQNTRDLCDHDLEHIGKLVHLRYLSLRGCRDIYHLPDSVGSMRQLQTLDIRSTSIHMLPKTIIKLKHLQYLQLDGRGRTLVPRGVGNLQALRTLGKVDIGIGNTLIMEIKKLTQLRKLQVTGIGPENCQEFCSALQALSCLESLSIASGNIVPCLSDVEFSPPNSLRTLMLDTCLLVKMPWIMHLRNLVKLRLERTDLTDSDGTMQLLGSLPDLAILTLGIGTFCGSTLQGQVLPLTLNFVPEPAFRSLVALDLHCACAQYWHTFRSEIKSVEFKQGAAPKLEMLRFTYWNTNTTMPWHNALIINDELFFGLASLPSLEKFWLCTSYSTDAKEAFVEHVQAQLAQNPKRPILCRVRGSWD